MLEPKKPGDELQRLAELISLRLLDTAPEERFDRVTRVAQRMFNVEIALVSLIDDDRQWFKSRQGLEAAQTPRSISFCGHAILSDEPLVVEDALSDPRFYDNPLVTAAPHIRFYAGIPLHGPKGYCVGTLCIIGQQPRGFSADDTAALADLGAVVETELGAISLSQALPALSESEIRFRTIFDNVIDGIITIDEKGTVEMINHAAVSIFGYQPEEVKGRNVSMLMPEPYRSAHDGYLNNYLETGEAKVIGIGREVIGRRKDGSTFPMELAVGEMILNGRRGFTGIVRDISKRRQVEELRSRLAAIIECSGDAIVGKSLDGVITSWNPGAVRMYGYSAAEAIGRPISMLVPADKMHEEARILSNIRHGKRVERLETVRTKKDGSRIEVSVTISPIVDGTGNITGASQIARDISEQKQFEEELRNAKRKAESASLAKSEFVANMSHELRTPMNAVLGMAYLLGTTALSADQRKYLDMIRTSGQSLLGILNDILDFSKIEAGRMDLSPAPFHLDEVLKTLAGIMSVNAGEKDLELAIGIVPGVPQALVGDALRLQQVLVNLVGNAIKFTEQGEVAVQVECVERSGDTVQLCFTVSDTGIGMSAEQQERLFLPFLQGDSSMTRRFGGTGLGLAISRRLTELMRGKIEVVSNPGQGSTFKVTVPLQVAGEPEAGQGNGLGDLRLLVVDDNDTSRHCLLQTIKGWRWQVDSAASGEQALECIRAQQDKGQRYDVVLADWQMPGMDGLDTMQAIRAMLPEEAMPIVIMVSAFGRGKLMRKEVALQADAVLIKPVNGSSLFDTLHEVLVARGAGRKTAPTASSGHRLDGVRLLLVEDNALNQIVAQGMLEQAGARVEVAENGQQAVDLLREDAQRCDLVLMDVQMPVLDGFSTTRMIRSELRLTLPVVAMTAGVMASEREQCTASGMDDFIPKPIEAEQLFATILRHVPLPPSRALPVSGAEAAVVDDVIETGVFDVGQLLSVGQDDPAYRRKTVALVGKLLEGAPEQVSQAWQAWREGRHDEAARLFHTMRGSIGTLGAPRYVAVTREIESAIRRGDALNVEPLWEQVERELAATLAAGRRWVAAQERDAMPNKVLDCEQLARWQALLGERDLAAFDLYGELRAALAQRLPEQEMNALERAMEQLDFATAQQCAARIAGMPE